MTALDDRYGRTAGRRIRGRVLAISAAVAIAAVMAAWAIWAGLLQPTAQLEAHDLGFEVLSDQETLVRVQLSLEPGRTASCALAAQDARDAYVGWAIVDVPASGERTREVSRVLRTTSRADVGLIYRCWLT